MKLMKVILGCSPDFNLNECSIYCVAVALAGAFIYLINWHPTLSKTASTVNHFHKLSNDSSEQKTSAITASN